MVAAKNGGRADIQTKYRTGYDRHMTMSFDSTVFCGDRSLAISQRLLGTRAVKADPFIPHTDSVRGFVYEVETGHLREVKI
jgi:hypothetical protein